MSLAYVVSVKTSAALRKTHEPPFHPPPHPGSAGALRDGAGVWDPRGPSHPRSGSGERIGLEWDSRDPATELQGFNAAAKSGGSGPPHHGQDPGYNREWQSLASNPSPPDPCFSRKHGQLCIFPLSTDFTESHKLCLYSVTGTVSFQMCFLSGTILNENEDGTVHEEITTDRGYCVPGKRPNSPRLLGR